jgi:hypothetical protein
MPSRVEIILMAWALPRMVTQVYLDKADRALSIAI